MGVLMQAFYWDCPAIENRSGEWWNFIGTKIPSLASNGFTSLWLPPVSKGGNISGMSMGYDPYDFYDLGDYDQKGSVKTWFGNKAELVKMIQNAHGHGMQVYADMVLNHNNGADKQELNPLDNTRRWTKFTPKSKKFPRNYTCFHPSLYEQWDNKSFGDMPDLCHRNPYVYTQLILYARWLLDTIGFDGFRYDFVLGYGGWMARAIQELRTLRTGAPLKPYGVGECWDQERIIDDWLDETNAWSDNPVGAFDFPLRWRLKDLCDSYAYSLKNLIAPGTLLADRPLSAVTFVENHDVHRDSPVVNDKMLAYAFILTHEGYPCVFWKDYYNYGLGQEGQTSGIAALASVHESHAAGSTSVLSIDDSLYIMQRNGSGNKPGLVFVLNNTGDAWRGTWVQTKWSDTTFVPVAWRGHDDTGVPQVKRSRSNGWCDFWAPQRGYAVYVPQ